MTRKAIRRLLIYHVIAFAALLSMTIVYAGVAPDEVGASIYTTHSRYNSGPDAWNNKTHGIYGNWNISEVGDFKLRITAAALRLSNDRDGVVIAAMVERGPLFITLGAVRGYEQVRYSLTRTASATLSCRNYCMWRSAKKRIQPTLAIGVRFDLPQSWKIRLSYQPRAPGDRNVFFDNRRDVRKDASATLWIGRAL